MEVDYNYRLILLQLLVAVGVLYCGVRLLQLLFYWRLRRVPHLSFSFSTSEYTWLFFNESRVMYYRKLYEQSSPHRYCGYYNLHRPSLLIRDPELIKAVLVTQFEDFADRRTLAPLERDEFFHFLFNLNDQRWKSSRQRAERAFNIGRLKNRMLEAMLSTAAEKRESLAALVNQTDSDITEFTSRYLVDLMFAALYGAEANAIDDSHSEYLKAARRVLARTETALKLNIAEWLLEPRYLGSYFGMSVAEEPTSRFYERQVLGSLKKRNEMGVTEIDLLGSFTKSSVSKEDDDSQLDDMLMAILYTIVPTMLSVSMINTALGCALYELARNAAAQRRLHEEIDEKLRLSGGQIDYSILNSMAYLKCVILETFRMYPTTPDISRICRRTCVLSGTDDVVEKGVLVVISISGMHYDPTWYPEPELFKPERFQEPESTSRHSYCYLPFSGGPRRCIGERLVKLTLETALVSLLSKYEVFTRPECADTLDIVPQRFFTSVRGIKLRFRERK